MTAKTVAKIIVKKERFESMRRKEVFTKYQQSAGVKTLATILHHQDRVDEDIVFDALGYLVQLSHQAMREAGCEVNKYGQFDFADGIYFDFAMPVEDKIFHLQTCFADESDKINELQELAL